MPRLTRSVSLDTQAVTPRLAHEIVLPLEPQRPARAVTAFDQPHYLRLIESRGATLRSVLDKLRSPLNLCTALDAGCGVGFFSKFLADLGPSVSSFDGRPENVAEARRRFPTIPFEIADVQDSSITSLGSFDLVLCFGLLYHLENPFRAIRHLRALATKCLLLESMCVAGERCELLLRQEPRVEDQSLTDMACYPTESALVKMLYRAGFPKVYRIVPLPDHEDFRDTPEHARRRTMLLASNTPIDIAGFRLMPEPQDSRDPWMKSAASRPSLPRRLWRFAKSPARSKYITLAMRARRRFPRFVIPWRLPFGAWWHLESSALDDQLLRGEFETAQLRFVDRYLQPGMTVLDIGAHHGLYTLLASRKVTAAGRVLAFEPSARERSRLQQHLRLNRCKNVDVLPCALGAEFGQADLYVVEGHFDFCNSLRAPDVPEAIQRTCVELRTLDHFLAEQQTTIVDFVKLDVEGGERDVLLGAQQLLKRLPRPVFLVEVEDRRTKSWNYQAKEIIDRFIGLGFVWHSVTDDGSLRPLDTTALEFEGNFVAIPKERMGEMASFLGPPASGVLPPQASPETRHIAVSPPEICANMNSRGEFVRPGGRTGFVAAENPVRNHSCTFFATAKAFEGHSGVIQRNALKSWTLLHPDAEVILFGDDKGAAEIASELGLRHIPYVERNEFGTKRLDSMFRQAQTLAHHDTLCYINCDIILLPEFNEALRRVRASHQRFLMIGRRWDTDITEPLPFDNPDWSKHLRQTALERGAEQPGHTIDYFVFRRGLYRDMPPLVVGRIWWDHWLIWRARQERADVVDVTPSAICVHQNHGYGYHAAGKQGVYTDAQARRNFALAGNGKHLLTMDDATHVLTPTGERRNWYRFCAPSWRVLRPKVIPVWFAFLDVTRPLRSLLGLRRTVRRDIQIGRAGERPWLGPTSAS